MSAGIKQTISQPYFTMVCTLTILFVLPRFGAAFTLLGCTTLLSWLIWVQPDSYRTRSGSLKLALGLVAAMFLGAAVVGVAEWIGQLE